MIPPDAFEPVSADYRVARLRLEDGHHVFQADPIFGVIVYGFDDYVSYGYPGGLDLKDLGLVNQRFEK